MTPEALTSEEAYERQRDAKIEWGRGLKAQMDASCRWFVAAGVKLECD